MWAESKSVIYGGSDDDQSLLVRGTALALTEKHRRVEIRWKLAFSSILSFLTTSDSGCVPDWRGVGAFRCRHQNVSGEKQLELPWINICEGQV